MMQTYKLVTAEDERDEKGKVVVPKGTVLNRVLWDGESPYTPPDGTELVLE